MTTTMTSTLRRQLHRLAPLSLAFTLGLGACALEPDSTSAADSELVVDGEICLHAEAFWRTHPELWPVGQLTLGANVYLKAELLLILDTPLDHDPLVGLAHDLIVAKLNLASGAADEVIAHVIATADLLIGPLVIPPLGEGHVAASLLANVVAALGDFNEGLRGPSLCDDDPPPPVCGNHLVEDGEACDDGNTDGQDGCDAECQIEPPCGCDPNDAGPPGDPGHPNGPGVPHVLPDNLEDFLDHAIGGVATGTQALLDGAEATLHSVDLAPTVDGAVEAVDEIVEGVEAGLNGTVLGDVVTQVDDLLHPESDCGNGVVEPGELCDAGDDNGLLGSLCSATCELLDDLLP